jgi:hypothetical protein
MDAARCRKCRCRLTPPGHASALRFANRKPLRPRPATPAWEVSGHKSSKNDPPPANQNSNQNSTTPPPTAAILMESQTTTSKFSSDPVDASHFDVPAGYKQIQSPIEKH